jgi:hypothetical protein
MYDISYMRAFADYLQSCKNQKKTCDGHEPCVVCSASDQQCVYTTEPVLSRRATLFERVVMPLQRAFAAFEDMEKLNESEIIPLRASYENRVNPLRPLPSMIGDNNGVPDIVSFALMISLLLHN